MEHPDPQAIRRSSGREPTATRSSISAEDWRTCSYIFTEGRRIRTLIGELRARIARGDLDAGARHAMEQYAHALETAASLGDVAAHTLTARH